MTPLPNNMRLDDPTSKAASAFALYALVAFVSLPFLQPYHDLPIPAFYSEWLAILLGMGVVIALLASAFWKNFSIPKVSVYLLAFVGLIAIQSLTAKISYPAQVMMPGLYLVWAALLAVSAAWLRRQWGMEKMALALAWGLLLGGAVQAAVGLLQYQQLSGWTIFSYEVRAVDGNLAQTNNFATHIMLAALALTYLFGERRIRPTVAVGLAALFAFVLALSTSRAVILFLSATLLLSLSCYWKSRNGSHLRYAYMTGLALILFIAWQFLLPLLDGRPGAPTTFERVRAMAGIDLRLSEWHKGWLMFLDAPIFGVGIGNYGWHSFLMQSAPDFAVIRKDELYAHSHNLFVQVLAELGGIGFLILLLLIAGWLKQYFRNWLKPSHWLIGTCLLVLFIHSNLEYPLWYSFFLGLAAVLLGLGDQRQIKLTFSPRLGQFTVGSTLLIATAILAITLAGYLQLAHINKVVADLGQTGAARVVQGVSGNQLLRPWAEAIAATHGVPEKNRISQQLALTTRVMEYAPDPIKVRRQIRYLALAGRVDEANALLHKASYSYAAFLPSYICTWITLPDKELHPIIEEADRLWNRPLQCQPNGDPIGHPSLRHFR